ncbi:MAG: S-layer homology domain-containing protein [Saccharofermentans sp.]|nr:S-layer homology domain-containing protein [Saccharofermentans sp.]
MIKTQYGAEYYCSYVFAPKKPIDHVDIGISVPVVGEHFSYIMDIDDDAPYYQEIKDYNSESDLNGMRWQEASVFGLHSVSWKEATALDQKYKLTFWIFAKEGYTFTKYTTITVNGGDIDLSEGPSSISQGEELWCHTAYMQALKPQDKYENINTVSATLKEPVLGNSPDYDPKLPSSVGYVCEDYDLKWYDITSGSAVAMNPATGKFEKNHKYRVDINLKAKEGYCFPETEIKATVNNKTAVLTRTDAYNAVLSQTFELKSDPVTLKLDKSSVNVVCGKTVTLKATTNSKDQVNWKSSNSKIATVDSKGKITAKMAGKVTITANVSGKSANCTVTVLYKDVTDPSEFWYAPTNYLTAKDVVKGYANQTEFRPANDCTRAQMVTFLYRLQGEPKTKSDKCNFTDVEEKDYYYKPVIWAVENGITTGVSKDNFNPKGVCSRAQTVTFLWRMAGKPEPGKNAKTFDDVMTTDYFYKATLWASDLKILAGLPDGTFNPQGKCLRRQMVTFLYKYDKYINGKG